MRRFLVLTRSILLMNLRDKATLFWNFAFPVGLILLYGAIWGGEDFGGIRAITWLMIGVVVLNIMASGFMGDSSWLTTSRDRGILLRIQASPLAPGALVSAYVAVRLLLVLLQSALIVVVAMLAFGAQIAWAALPVAFLIALLGALVFIALGQAIAAVAPSAGAAVAIGQVFYFPLMFISNLFMPVELLPDWLAAFTRWNPAYMLVDLIRPVLVPEVVATQALWINVGGLLLYGALGLLLAARLFRWEPRR